MLLTTMTGDETFGSASAKCHVFWSPTHNSPGREVHIGVAAKDPDLRITTIQHPAVSQAAPGFIAGLGQWATATYDVPDGTLLKVFTTRSGGYGSMQVRANVFIQMRERAALRRIRVHLTGDSKAQFRFATIQGRFDVLTLAQAREIGAKVPVQFERFFDETMISRACEITDVEAEVAPRPTIETRTVEQADGTTRVVQVSRKGRALEI